MEHQTHFFYAIRIPEGTKGILKNHIEQLRTALPFQRWVHHLDLHITLAFLGSAPAEKLEASVNNVKSAIKSEQAFTLKINDLGIFGAKDSPRVFWADTEESPELQALRKKIFQACEEAGFELEKRPFRPHITMARKWRGDAPFQKEQLTIWKELQPESLPFLAGEVVLYQTHLNQTPKYEAIKLFPLQT
ncbi:RNA 2',3'-cyclic phosphodiesterase [Neobacillus sp. GCM10023253]|uniref:RNA 2',3'-cyclic phosphodiesterase n=1 Tax=Neobacillus sp. GCM10023253 TaxID=3252644 RepID=UPI00361C3F42